MRKLPSEIKLTLHAIDRLKERNSNHNYYNERNLMKSNCKWYTKDDLIPQSALYLHCCYVCRKSKQMGYITDGNIEVIYNKGTGVAITVLEVKEKFLPITQYIKPSVLEQIEMKKVGRKMRKLKVKRIIGQCPDCGREDTELMVDGMYEGICDVCKRRKQNAKARNREYIPYVNLSEDERKRIDSFQRAQAKKSETAETVIVDEKSIPQMANIENYYQVKAENNPALAHIIEKPIIPHVSAPVNPLEDPDSFVNTLQNHGCEIPQETLKEVLDVLVSTDKLKDIFMVIAKNESQDAILNLEQALNVVERKLQHNWEYNGFQEADDIQFKSFLTWRRVLKGAIFFWKKLYQTNALIEMQRAWNAYTADPNDKILLAGDRIDTALKRYQITTESVSTIFNTKRPFTRVFYAKNEEEAHEMLVKWFADRQLHENKSKTVITELKSDGSSVYEVK